MYNDGHNCFCPNCTSLARLKKENVEITSKLFSINCKSCGFKSNPLTIIDILQMVKKVW